MLKSISGRTVLRHKLSRTRIRKRFVWLDYHCPLHPAKSDRILQNLLMAQGSHTTPYLSDLAIKRKLSHIVMQL